MRTGMPPSGLQLREARDFDTALHSQATHSAYSYYYHVAQRVPLAGRDHHVGLSAYGLRLTP
jgi:hypothetical protein